MIYIKTLELYREFQKNIMKVVESEALMSGFNEYTVSIRNHSTEVTIYLHGYAAVLIFYISGRVVVKYIVSKNDHEETILIDKTDWQYFHGKCTVADLVSRYVFEVFNAALELRQQWRTEYRERYNERMAAMAAAVNETVSVPESDDGFIKVSEDSYLMKYDEF